MPDQDQLTASAVLSVCGTKIELDIAVPSGPTVPSRLLPVFRAIADAVVAAAVEEAEGAGLAISCRRGCGACCRQLVPISRLEARQLAKLVDEAEGKRKLELVTRFERARETLQTAGLLSKLQSTEGMTAEERTQLGLEYFRQRIACPFLEEESCSIYSERPIACREYLVTSPAQNCANPSPKTVKCVSVPLEVSKAVRSFDAEERDADRWVPLTLALDWAGTHRESETSRPGAELIRELFSKLTGKEPPHV